MRLGSTIEVSNQMLLDTDYMNSNNIKRELARQLTTHLADRLIFTARPNVMRYSTRFQTEIFVFNSLSEIEEFYNKAQRA